MKNRARPDATCTFYQPEEIRFYIVACLLEGANIQPVCKQETAVFPQLDWAHKKATPESGFVYCIF